MAVLPHLDLCPGSRSKSGSSDGGVRRNSPLVGKDFKIITLQEVKVVHRKRNSSNYSFHCCRLQHFQIKGSHLSLIPKLSINEVAIQVRHL